MPAPSGPDRQTASPGRSARGDRRAQPRGGRLVRQVDRRQDHAKARSGSARQVALDIGLQPQRSPRPASPSSASGGIGGPTVRLKAPPALVQQLVEEGDVAQLAARSGRRGGTASTTARPRASAATGASYLRASETARRRPGRVGQRAVGLRGAPAARPGRSPGSARPPAPRGSASGSRGCVSRVRLASTHSTGISTSSKPRRDPVGVGVGVEADVGPDGLQGVVDRDRRRRCRSDGCRPRSAGPSRGMRSRPRGRRPSAPAASETCSSAARPDSGAMASAMPPRLAVVEQAVEQRPQHRPRPGSPPASAPARRSARRRCGRRAAAAYDRRPPGPAPSAKMRRPRRRGEPCASRRAWRMRRYLLHLGCGLSALVVVGGAWSTGWWNLDLRWRPQDHHQEPGRDHQAPGAVGLGLAGPDRAEALHGRLSATCPDCIALQDSRVPEAAGGRRRHPGDRDRPAPTRTACRSRRRPSGPRWPSCGPTAAGRCWSSWDAGPARTPGRRPGIAAGRRRHRAHAP